MSKGTVKEFDREIFWKTQN